MTSGGKPPAHLAVLDGVRGFAICLVLGVHFTPDYLMPNRPLEWLKKLIFAGWTGVDLFFVLSGFLITGILLRVRKSPGFLRSFYLRRALRIWPLYLGTLAVVFGVLPWLVPAGSDPAFDRLCGRQGWYWMHCANVAVLLHSFAETSSRTVNLGHLWSLAVEEHFYLVWPFLIGWLPDRKRIPALLAIIVGALGLRLLALATLRASLLPGACVQMPLRMDGLACGALTCVLLQQFPAAALRRGAWMAGSGTALALAFVFFRQKGLWIGSAFMQSIGFTVLAVLYSSLLVILLTSPPGTFLRRAFESRALRFFGKYSYALYILHFLIYPWLERAMPPMAVLARLHSFVLAAAACLVAKTALSVALALLSWHLLEAPCLRLKERFAYVRA